jgi:tetratricopeptide (TPR) repeat protein
MNIRKIAAITVLVFSSLAATNVAPSKSELEEMYNKAFRDFEANSFPDALKELDAIDARQPDLAESQNLRGVILMREGIYDKAEAALLEAVRIDPKFWNARFNLAEIPFLKKDWAEARTRFQQLLSSNVAGLEGEATQLIQYKILLTYLLEGNENMVDSILSKFELSPDTPAVHYANAAIALQHKKNKEARDLIVVAEKNFSPQLNKVFAESLYEVGWLEKPAGQTRPSLPLATAAERTAKTKAAALSSFEQAQQAVQQRDFATARKFIDEADAADPNQAPILNLRGEILLELKAFDEAEAAFKKASKADPKFREAQYNLAQIPFKKKDYARARERFDTLLKQTPGGDKNQAAQIIKFKIYMTLLLEGKESRAQKMMEQFQFTGDTPALYYAQAAWEFQHNNPNKATDWIVSAKKIYSPSLNNLFGDAFYDLGWLQSPAVVASSAPTAEATAAMSAPTESSPAIEPSPIPTAVAAANNPIKEAKTESSPSSSPAASPAIAGMEATSLQSAESPAAVTQPPLVASNESTAPTKPEEASAASTAAPTVETQVSAASPSASIVALAAPVSQGEQTSVAQSEPSAPPSAAPAASAPAAVAATPATVLAPTRVREWSRPVMGETPQTLLVGGLLVAATFLLAWVIVPAVRRRLINITIYRQPAPVTGPSFDEISLAPSQEHLAAVSNHFVGGPRRVSLQLRASEPSLRRSVLPLGKLDRAFGGGTIPASGPVETFAYRNPEPEVESVPEPVFQSSVGPVLEQVEIPSVDFAPSSEVLSSVILPGPEIQEPIEWANGAPTGLEMTADPVIVMGAAPVAEAVFEPEVEPIDIEFESWTTAEAVIEPEVEPIGQGQPIPYQMSVSAMEPSMAETVETPSFVPAAVSADPSIPQTTTPVTMPEPIQIPTAQVTRTPAAVGAPQPAGTPPQPAGITHTAVQLTFSFEIASMQLTPTFKMGALQVRPTSKIVTMRLAPTQQAQPAMNLQVTFEIAKIQPAGGALGTVRLTPSQQQRPTATGSPSFTVGGLQLVPNFEAAPLQLTPSQQGQASVLVTAPFQIGTVEFSPSFEIAAIVLNSSSKQVAVQLPGAALVSGEGIPMFEIANLQLTGGGEIGMIQLNLLGHGPRRP